MAESQEGEDLLFSTMVIMVTGTFFFYNLNRINVPYTVIMFTYGLILGLASLVFSNWYDRYVSSFAEIPPRMLFHIFLPVLIFEGSYGVKTYALKRILWHAVVLAGPGLMINTVMVGAATKYFVYPDWNWYAAFLLGSILSATDPVAVVTLLKDLGVDASLTAVIDAEALMNDGTAIICFELLLPAVNSGELDGTFWELFFDIIRLTVGAVVFGLFMGWFSYKVIMQCRAYDLVTTLQTICFAYIAFFVADELIETSGVLTLFCMGSYLAKYLPSQFPGSHHSLMSSTWHFLVHALNTVIFTLVGIIIARRCFDDFDFVILWTMIFMYAVCVLARFLMIGALLPLMNGFGRFHLEWRHILLQVHGGLRGGVATILVLMVVESGHISPAMQEGFIHITSGIVLITILFNATTAAACVKRLDLQAKPQNRLVQMAIGVKQVNEVVDRALQEIKSEVAFREANWPLVEEIVKGVANPFEDLTCIAEDEDDIFIAILMRVFKTDIWRQRDTNRISEEAVRVLTEAAVEHIRRRSLMSISEVAEDAKSYPFYSDWLAKINLGFTNKMVLNIKDKHDSFFFCLLVSYSEGLRAVERAAPDYARSQEHLTMVESWLSRERQEIDQLIDQFQKEKPLASVSVITSIASALIMQRAEHMVEHLHHDKGFTEFDTGSLSGAVDEAKHPIDRLHAEIDPASPEQVFALSSIGSGISDATVSLLSRCWTLQSVAADTEIDIGTCIGVVVKGIATLVSFYDAPLVPGSVWGAEAHVVNFYKKARPIVAVSDVTYLTLSRDNLIHWMQEDPLFAQNVKVTAARGVAEELLAHMTRFQGFDDERIQMICQSGLLITVPAHNQIPISDSDDQVTFFVQGADRTGLVTEETSPFVVPRCAKFRWTENTLLYRVQTGIGGKKGGRAGSAARARTRGRTIVAKGALSGFGEGSEMSAINVTGESGSGGSPLVDVNAPLETIVYKPEDCVTPVPYFNRFQLFFVVELEQLGIIIEAFESNPSFKHRHTLMNAIDQTLQFLSRYCVNNFGKESFFYKLANLQDYEEHKAHHERFQKQLGIWLERRAAAEDQLPHREIYAEMVGFVKKHFPLDQRDVSLAVGGLPPRDAALAKKMHTDKDFLAIERDMKARGMGLSGSRREASNNNDDDV